MGIDYNETLAHANFWRENIAPYLQNLTSGAINFADYLQAFYKYPQPIKTFGMPFPYIYTLKWLQKHQDKCIAFFYNQGDEVAKGAAPLSAIYQMSPRLHMLSNIYTWRDEGENDGHITFYAVYEKFEEVLKVADDNQELIKKPKIVNKGFGTAM